MTPLRLAHVVGARPNFMKAAAVMSALGRRSHIRQTLVHTGQHYTENMSGEFLYQLGLPEPDVNLRVGSGSHAEQTAAVMVSLECYLVANSPDTVVVYGDVNSTAAAALVAAKLHIPVAHVEAGLRSRDRSMPEEINRIVTDRLSSFLFTPSADGTANLLAEGADPQSIHLVGNVMIDTLVRLLPQANAERVVDQLKMRTDEPYILTTLHRPSNVDDPAILRDMLESLMTLATRVPVLFPVHPRTRAQLRLNGHKPAGFHLIEPLSYLEFISLERHAALVITDSGGVQEETTFLGVPCLTVRNNTERPITTEVGTNTLVGCDAARLEREATAILTSGLRRPASIPALWDGHAADRIADVLGKHARHLAH